MAASPVLLQAVRKALRNRRGVEEKVMFGGVCFMLRGHMLCGVETDRFMFRVGPAHEAKALSLAGASPMDFTGRPLKGYVFVEGKRRITPFIALATDFVGALPPKAKSKTKPKKKPQRSSRE